MRIQHNIPAMNAYRNYTNNTSNVSKNLEKLSSGYRINRAGDDAAGLAISEKMRAQITGLQTAQKNAKDGISLIQTGEGALTEVHSMLNRMVELANQSANGTYDNDVDRANLQKEIASLTSEIDRIADSTNYNGINLLDGSKSAKGGTSVSDVNLSKLSGAMAGATSTVDSVKGKYEMNVALDMTTPLAGMTAGDKINVSFDITDSNGKVQNIAVELTAQTNDAGDINLFSADGTEYKLATSGEPILKEISDAVVTELNKNDTIKNNFAVSHTNGKLDFTAKVAGTGAPSVTGVSVSSTKAGVVTLEDNAMKTATKATDAFESLDLSKATVFDGSKGIENSIFEINGKKFAFVEKGKVTDDALAKMKQAGVNHFVEVGTGTTIAAADIKSMGEKIALETGLTVEQGTATTTAGVTAWTKTNGNFLAFTSGTSKTGSGGLTLQIGDSSAKFNQLTVSIGDMHAKSLGISGLDISTQAGAAAATDLIKAAINTVSGTRGDLGALQNRLEHTINNLSVAEENITSAEAAIRDVDVAKEMMAYTKNNILVQSAQAMLAQANQLPQGVLQLLQ